MGATFSSSVTVGTVTIASANFNVHPSDGVSAAPTKDLRTSYKWNLFPLNK